ncbi:hypothetical protein J2X01_000304 [Arthrobacter ginsengisoli]|uniref:Uncharacterized protein n=1 Tax=Arthrobacter ginsengisoli TaxID=1356565 RepID=A0ABU1U780_9MICC|nr:hypothetical protein [Arthrobacter ginsengisoli]MDR7081035.1 hypothetical protein [Arthrobacter ginsengisoli]
MNAKMAASSVPARKDAEAMPHSTVRAAARGLHAADGLFLRAAHLEAIQEYARSLALSAGMAAGTGVVWGFPLRLLPDSLEVGPGLAIHPQGFALQSIEAATLDLEQLNNDGTSYWILEAEPGAQLYEGSEPSYGNICQDSCPGATIQPWQQDTVLFRLRAETFPGLDDLDTDSARSRLASHYFERERRLLEPWLTPRDSTGRVSPLLTRSWAQGLPAKPDAKGVPLALLVKVGNEWVLDVWAARRDIDGAVSSRALLSRLGMRPWNTFMAQILQFQAQLAETSLESSHTDEVSIKRAVEVIGETIRRLGEERAEHLLSGYLAGLREGPASTLDEAGFTELPPAGFIADPGQEGRSLQSLTAFFGGKVGLRLIRSSADAALSAVAEAQHLDRIPLNPRTENQALIDVYIPSVEADLDAVRTETYGWLAFVRRRRTATEAPERGDGDSPEDSGQKVGVCFVKSQTWFEGDLEATATRLAKEWSHIWTERAAFSYHERSDALIGLGPDEATEKVMSVLKGTTPIAVIGLTADPNDVDVMKARAASLLPDLPAIAKLSAAAEDPVLAILIKGATP